LSQLPNKGGGRTEENRHLILGTKEKETSSHTIVEKRPPCLRKGIKKKRGRYNGFIPTPPASAGKGQLNAVLAAEKKAKTYRCRGPGERGCSIDAKKKTDGIGGEIQHKHLKRLRQGSTEKGPSAAKKGRGEEMIR